MLNTGYYEYGVIVKDRIAIIKNYFRLMFWSEFLPLVDSII